MCRAAEVILKFLPPYSPDMNPIEEAFAEMKAWMKRNNELQATYDDFTKFLEAALMYMANKAGNHFRSAGIIWWSEKRHKDIIVHPFWVTILCTYVYSIPQWCVLACSRSHFFIWPFTIKISPFGTFHSFHSSLGMSWSVAKTISSLFSVDKHSLSCWVLPG